MISSTGSHNHIDTLARAEATVSVTASVPDQETVLAPSQTVKPTSNSEQSAQAENDNLPAIISLSSDVITALQGEEAQATGTQATEAQANNRPPPPPPPEESNSETATGLTEEEQSVVDALSDRDQEVRSHERAHASSGGALAGSPSFEFETGPDGQQYAVGGEVQIDTAPIAGDPSATIAKMETIIRAALAPAEPSGQDRAVAAAAAQMKIEALAELNASKQTTQNGDAMEENDTSAEFSPAEPSSSTSFVNPAASGSSDKIINIIA